MTDHDTTSSEREESGLSGFLRGLLAGVPWSESASDEVELRFDPPSGGLLELHNPNGKTRVLGEDRSDIQVRARKQARAESQAAAEQLLDEIGIRAQELAGHLELSINVPRKWNRHGSVDLEVCVPRNIELKVSSTSGKLCLQGLRAGVCAHSGNGSVRLVDIVGNIEITTANAKVSCACTSGRLVARSSNGKIVLGEHRGSIDATTSNGLIHVSLEQLSKEGIALATSNGRIILELPDHPDAEVDVRVDNGVIRNEIELGNQVSETAGRLRGRLGCGGTPIRLRTSNGTVSLRRCSDC
ncbi:MAG: DUF4097 family beta strand repeat protein [Deltaproteobacteria bacterium]|nr:DUF4097 family beta strand repeat protein [Deltaproteobacteria bacterium]MBW2384422.1 DUF4097 family beta strand repeat protein [Deltaproteobacteria bacterium]MBW2697715.1 DUF4097 family beta strand repeat protein [Deltaproteobacteria bacterium]